MARKKVIEHSSHYDLVKAYYDLYIATDGKAGWSKARVHKAVECGWITAEEYEEITGEEYV